MTAGPNREATLGAGFDTLGVMRNLALHLACTLTFATLLLAPSPATATPKEGSNELRIDSSYLMPGYSVTGLTHTFGVSGAGASSSSQTIFGIGFAYGRFLTDNFEIGTSLTLIYLSSGSSTATAPGFSPFIRGFTMVSERAGFFASATAGLQYVSEDGGTSITELIAGVDLGFEFFLAESWSLRVAPTYRYVHESLSNGSSSASAHEHVLGLNYAIAGYF